VKRRLVRSALLVLPALVFLLNYSLFQLPVDRVLERDERNAGMVVRAHWRWYIDPTVLVYDLKGAGPQTTGLDVLRAFLQFAYRQKGRHFDRVVLAWQGSPRFYMSGADFADLGRQYVSRSPVDTMVVLPPLVRRMDGSKAYPVPAGQAWLVQQQKQLLDFNSFVNAWTAAQLRQP
jgi:hypothetical protein